MKFTPPAGFVPIRTSTLVTQWSMAMDVFVYVDGKPLRYVANGYELDNERFERLRSHKILKVLIRKEDEDKYRSLLEEVMNEAENNNKIPLAERSKTMTGNAENAAQSISEKPEDEGTFKSSANTFDRMSRFLNKTENAYMDVLKNHSGRASDYVAHGIQVASLSQVMAEKMGLIKVPEWRKFLMTGASIHDLGAEKLGLPLKIPEEYTAAEKPKWLDHTNVAYQTFNQKDFVDPIVIQIVSQHEEVPNGSGFPNKLSFMAMNPLSVIVSICNTFDYYMIKHDKNREAALSDFMQHEIGKYELNWLTVLQGLVKAVK